MAEVRVRDMTTAEYDEWREVIARRFAASQVAAGTWAPDDAYARAVEANDAFLPDGRATAGMLFLKATRPDGTPVGVLWVGLTHPRGVADCAFIYDIEIDEAYRGLGYGRALLAAAEAVVRSRGVGALELNVFAENTRAVRLYDSAGYRVVTQQMRKSLTEPVADRSGADRSGMEKPSPPARP